MRRNLMIAATSIGLGLLSFALYSQSVPTTINYQGRLTDNAPAQTPIDGTVSMQFEIWDVASGGSASPNRLWREPNLDDTAVSVPVSGGIFNYLIGATEAIPPTLFTGASTTRYLQIIINPGPSQEILTPRQLIGATGYANLSENANAAGSAITATTASALLSNGANCPPGSFPLGIDAGGAVEDCTTAGTGTVTNVTAAAPLSVSNGGTTPNITLNGIVPVANGGTGSSSLNFVTLTSSQTVTGAKTLFPSSNSPSLVLRQSTIATAGTDILAVLNGGGTATYLTVDSTGKLIWSGTATGSISGNAATASTAVALVANGANCAAGSFPLGVDASGNAESCASAISGNAATASALGANGTNCAAGSLASGVDASGNAEGCANTISGNAGSATAVAWTGVTGKPAGFADNVDNDTTYTAGSGLKLSGAEFSLNLNNSTPTANSANTINSVNNVGQYTSATIGDDGLPLISYYDVTNGNLMVSHCADAGCTSATSATVDNSAADVGRYSSITIGRDGLGLISYYDATGGNLKVAHCSDIPCTTATITVLDSSASVGQYSSITIASDGFGIISYYDATNGNLKVADCSNLACSVAGIVTADASANDVGRYSSIAVNLNGEPVLGYQDTTGLNPVVAVCGTPNCSSPLKLNVDTTFGGGFMTSVAVGEDGGIILSHLAAAAQYELHIVHCNGPVCSSPTVTIVDTNLGNSAFPTSITIGTDGNPIVAYHDASANLNLNTVYCRNASCTTYRSSTLDSVGNVGSYAAITIGRDGLPLISYYDTTNTALKTVHCASKYCLPYFRRR